MLTWLIDDPTWLYMLLVIVALGFGFAWWRTKLAKFLLGSAAALALIGTIWLLGLLIETDQKRIEWKINEMAAGVAAHDVARVFAHISDQFRFGGLDKANFRQKVEGAMNAHNVMEIKTWNFNAEEISREHRRATVSFDLKARGNWSEGREFYSCQAQFVLDPDDQWRLSGFELFLPQTHNRVEIPGF